MSASSKKKLRKESAASMLTEKQQKELSEAKKLKAITATFVIVMLVVVLTAVGLLGIRAVNNSGIIDKNTVAAVTGTHELNSIQLNYYFVDIVQSTYNQWKSTFGESFNMYMSMMQLNLNASLNSQPYMGSTTETWADHFLKEALDRAKSDYALYDMAMKEGFTLSEDEQMSLDYNTQMIEIYAAYSGAGSVNKYLRSIYGYGATLESYKEYSQISGVAAAYYTKYSDSLTYTDAEIREHEKDKYDEYSNFSYAVFEVNQQDYLTGGTKDDKGNTTYSDEEKAAALKAAEDQANSLVNADDITSLDKAIALIKGGEDKADAATTKYDNVAYDTIPADLRSWIIDKNRVANDMTVIPKVNTSTDENNVETKTTVGYYVVCFTDRNDNERPLANVRHLLISFEGGTTDANGKKVYTEAEKATAKAKAEELLQTWKDGAATEESFIELVKANSKDTGSVENGGLYEDIHPESNFVDSFKAWSLDTSRKPGDTGVIVSDYGYHVMYYSSDDELTYRDHMITEDLRTAAVETWYNGIVDAATITTAETKRLKLDLVPAIFG